MRSVLAACGGFLLAVLWFDLMFDVQVLAHPAGAPLPEAVLASIAGYYNRVTVDAFPLNRLVGVVMFVAVAGSTSQLLTRRVPRWAALAALLLCLAPVGLGLTRVFPDAVRLAGRTGSVARQSELARRICRDHLFCLGSIALFVALQLAVREESS
jgi:hypothetical protein